MTDQALLELIQYALVEPPDGGATWPSGLWTRDEVLAALNTRMRQYLRDTQAVVTRAEIAVAAGTNPIDVPIDWIATLGAVWRIPTTGLGIGAVSLGSIYLGQTYPLVTLLVGGTRYPLSTGDAFEADLALPTWESAGGTPIVILDGDDGTLTVRLAPVPDVDGVLELLYVALPAVANGNGVTLSIPDEALDGIRYGTLADLLGKVGRGSDPVRAKYCQERFEQDELVTEILLNGWA